LRTKALVEPLLQLLFIQPVDAADWPRSVVPIYWGYTVT